MKHLNLDVPAPDHVPRVLRAAAQAYRESADELATAHQDPRAGKPWLEIARVLDRAAEKIDHSENIVRDPGRQQKKYPAKGLTPAERARLDAAASGVRDVSPSSALALDPVQREIARRVAGRPKKKAPSRG